MNNGLITLGRKKEMGENGQRIFSLHNALDFLQAPNQDILTGGQLHNS